MASTCCDMPTMAPTASTGAPTTMAPTASTSAPTTWAPTTLSPTCPAPGTYAPTASTGAPTTMAPTASTAAPTTSAPTTATTCATYCSDDHGYLACDGIYCDAGGLGSSQSACSMCSTQSAADQSLVGTASVCPTHTCSNMCTSDCAAYQSCLSSCSSGAGVEQTLVYAFGCDCTFAAAGISGGPSGSKGSADEGSTIKPMKLVFVAAVLGAMMV